MHPTAFDRNAMGGRQGVAENEDRPRRRRDGGNGGEARDQDNDEQETTKHEHGFHDGIECRTG
jgi:hypothetical protein